MKSEPATEEEIRLATLAMKARLARFVIGGNKAIDFRTATVLQKNGVMTATDPVTHKGITFELIEDSQHAERAPGIPSGPLFFKLEYKDGKANRLIIDVASLFFDGDVRMRKAALHFVRIEIVSLGRCTANTAATIDRLAGNLLSEDQALWQSAAIYLADAIGDDFLINLAGVEQAMATDFGPGFENFLTRVLRPSMRSIEGLPLVFWNGREDRHKIESVIGAAVLNDDLSAAFDHYYEACGHIPLASNLSLGGVLDGWKKEPRDADQLWRTIWAWADQKETPLARYHACQVFVTHPDLIPESKSALLWQEILSVINLSSDTDKTRARSEAWRLRCDLARHFGHYFESRAPGQSAERICILAWWLTERIAGLFGIEADTVHRFREQTVEFEYEFSRNCWQLLTPPVVSDALRYGTLMTNSIWALSLQCEINPALAERASRTLDDEQRSEFERSLSATLVTLFPRQVSSPAFYAFENGMHHTAEAYASGRGSDPAATIRGLLTLAGELAKPERFDELMGDFANAGESEATILGQALRVRVYLKEAPLDVLWKYISDAKWRDPLLAKSTPRTLAILSDIFMQIEASAGGNWATHLPHFFAMACEQASDSERREGLFFCTLLASVCGDNVSAIHRLLRGRQRSEFVRSAARFVKRLDHLQPAFSAWGAGRVRALRAALSAV